MNYSIKYFAVSPEIDKKFDQKALSMKGKKINNRTYVFDDLIRPSDFADLGHEVYIGINKISQRVVDGEEYDVNPHWGEPVEQDFSSARRAKSNNSLKEMLKTADEDLRETDAVDHECEFYPIGGKIAADVPEKPKEEKKKKSFLGFF